MVDKSRGTYEMSENISIEKAAAFRNLQKVLVEKHDVSAPEAKSIALFFVSVENFEFLNSRILAATYFIVQDRYGGDWNRAYEGISYNSLKKHTGILEKWHSDSVKYRSKASKELWLAKKKYVATIVRYIYLVAGS